MTRSQLIVALLDLPPSDEDIEFFFSDHKGGNFAFKTLKIQSIVMENKTQDGIGPHPIVYLDQR